MRQGTEPAAPGPSGAAPGPRGATSATPRRAPAADYGLVPRPEPDPAVVALVAAAADQVWPRPTVAEAPEGPDPLRWRFSGRWWTRPVPVRRERPWLR